MKKFIALMTALFAVIAIIFAYVVNSSPRIISSGETTVKEMPDTHIDIFHNYSMNYNECTRYFVISNPPDDFMEEKLDRFVAEATAKYSEKRKEENDSILAAFLEKKPTVPRTQKQNISKTNDTEQKSEKDKVQDDLLKQLFG